MFTFRALFGALPNYGDAATLSGGSWASTLPINNVKNRILKKVARSTDADLASTKYEGDFGASKRVGVIGLLNLNWSKAAKWRFRLKAAAGGGQPAVEFDGAHYGTILTGAGLLYGQANDFAVGMWIKINTMPTYWGGLFSAMMNDASPAFPHSMAVSNNGKMRFYWTTGSVLHEIDVPFAVGLEDLQWHHIGWSVSGTTLMIAFDGQEIFTTTDAALAGRDTTGAAADILLGREGDTGWLAASFYMVAHWGAARTAEQFDSDMFRTFTGSEGGLTGLWNGTITAGTLNNLTSNDLDFTVTGATVDSWTEFPVIYDSGKLDANPPVEEFGTLPWGEFQWGGALPAEVTDLFKLNVYHVCTSILSARYYSVEVFDQTNADGYVEIGRAMVGPYFQPILNMDYGFGIGFEDGDTIIDKSRGGQLYAELHDVFRAQRFSFSNMTEAEALQQVLFYLQRRQGTTGDLLFIPFPLRPEIAFITAMYCRMRSLAPVYNSAFNQWQTQFELEELL